VNADRIAKKCAEVTFLEADLVKLATLRRQQPYRPPNRPHFSSLGRELQFHDRYNILQLGCVASGALHQQRVLPGSETRRATLLAGAGSLNFNGSRFRGLGRAINFFGASSRELTPGRTEAATAAVGRGKRCRGNQFRPDH
jgi:hypothetical protein